jgi:hypothetical protein
VQGLQIVNNAPTDRRFAAITLTIALLLVHAIGLAQAAVYTGRVNMLNEQDGKIIINVDDGSTGNWSIGRGTTVVFQGKRQPHSMLLSSKHVKVMVNRDGSVGFIEILEMSDQGAPPSAPGGTSGLIMGGKEVHAVTGRVNMLNEQYGNIIINIDDGSNGNWQVGNYTVVLRGAQREPLSLLLSSKRVRVWVARDGTVQRVEILQM